MSILIAVERNYIPILEIRSTVDFNLEAPIVISTILKIIEEAEKFGGIPISEPANFNLKAKTSISISLLFKSHKDLKDYVKNSQIIRHGNLN